jgi:hypothetical protein
MVEGPTGESEPPARTSLPVKIGFGLLLVLLALFGFVVFRHGGKPDLTHWSTYVEAFTGQSSGEQIAGDLRAEQVASTAYRNRDGHRLVVLWGQVRNTSDEPKSAVAVTGKLLDDQERVLGELTVPAGVAFDPEDVFAMTDAQAVGDAYRARYGEQDRKLDPGARLPFMVVMFDHPDRLDGLRVQIAAGESRDPLSGLPPPAPEPTAGRASTTSSGWPASTRSAAT